MTDASDIKREARGFAGNLTFRFLNYTFVILHLKTYYDLFTVDHFVINLACYLVWSLHGVILFTSFHLPLRFYFHFLDLASHTHIRCCFISQLWSFLKCRWLCVQCFVTYLAVFNFFIKSLRHILTCAHKILPSKRRQLLLILINGSLIERLRFFFFVIIEDFLIHYFFLLVLMFLNHTLINAKFLVALIVPGGTTVWICTSRFFLIRGKVYFGASGRYRIWNNWIMFLLRIRCTDSS